MFIGEYLFITCWRYHETDALHLRFNGIETTLKKIYREQVRKNVGKTFLLSQGRILKFYRHKSLTSNTV